MIKDCVKKVQKVMLMVPRYTLFKEDVRRCITPIGLAYLGGFLEREGYEVKILDIANEGYDNAVESDDGKFVTYGLDDETVKKKIDGFKPDVVGVSCIFSSQAGNAKHVLKITKEVDEDIITLVGGSHPTYAVGDFLDIVNFIVLGEGELPTSQLLDALNNDKDVSEIDGLAGKYEGIKFINSKKQYIGDLNSLSFPARHLLNMEMYFRINTPQNPYPKGKRIAQIMTSRGCSARCVFCTTTNFWGNRYRGRSAQSVINEIKELKEKYNIDEIQITDDNFTLNKNRAMEILDAIKDFGLHLCAPQGLAAWALDNELLEKMKEAGFYQLTFAVESGNQRVLNEIVKKPLDLAKVKPLVKKAQEIGIKVHSFAICGLPGETIENMNETYNFVSDCGFDSSSFFAATPLVGSELLNICEKKDYLRKGAGWNEQLFKLGNINTKDFTSVEVEELAAKFNREYNKNDTREKRFEPGKY
ncbi:MAG: radical SAM protein [archaeon]